MTVEWRCANVGSAISVIVKLFIIIQQPVTHVLQKHVQLWMQTRIDGDFKQRFVQIVKELLKAADDVVQFVNITAQQDHIHV